MQFSSNKNRVLSVFSLVMINVIAIDSLRNLPTNAKMGLTIAFYYLIAGLVFLVPCALITAELATHRPRTGGVYVWVREAFGEKWGFFNIWLQWIYNVVWYPTVLSFLAVNIAYLVNPALATDKVFIVGVVLVLFSIATFVNQFGMQISGWVSVVSALLGTIIPMLIIIAFGAYWIMAGKTLAIAPTLANITPSSFNSGNIAFLVVVFFSLMGIEMSAVHAEEVKNPRRDYPRALLYSSLLIMTTMIFASSAIAIVVPKSQLSILSGIDQAAATLLGAFGLKAYLPVVIVLILLGGFGGMAAWVIGPTKGLMVAAEDGCLPKAFMRHNKRGVPVNILLAQYVIVIALCSLFFFFKFINTSYWILSDLTAQLALLFYIVFFAAAIKLRKITPCNDKAFRIPGGRASMWIVAGVGILACLFAIAIGFIPPSGEHITNDALYEGLLIGGVVLFSLPPFLIYKYVKK